MKQKLTACVVFIAAVLFTSVIAISFYTPTVPSVSTGGHALPDVNVPDNTVAPDDVNPSTSGGAVPAVDASRVISFNQFPDYPTGCESAALYILLRYYGVDVTMDDIVSALPKEPNPYIDGGVLYGGDPDRGFIGDPTDPFSYGVLNHPIAEAANKFLEGAEALVGLDAEDIESYCEGSAVIAWISMSPEIEPKITVWTDHKTGKDVTWVSGEHAVVVYASVDGGYMISDPRTGTKHFLSSEDFSIGFERYGGRIVYYP